MRFVVQGPALGASQLQTLSELCGSERFAELEPHAYYLHAAEFPRRAEISAYCAEQGIDCAFVPDEQVLENFGLVVMDMDSTLINIECIDEIADMQGLKPQVAAITEAAMRGEIEFAESLRRRVALLQGLDQAALRQVYDERLQLSPGADKLIATLKARGIKAMLVSGGFDYFTDGLKARLGLDYAHGNRLEVADGKFTGKVLGDIIDAQGKADWLTRTRDELGLRPEQVIAIGDGANDLRMLAAAGVGIAYHAKPVVQRQATYALNHAGLDGVLNLFRGRAQNFV